MLVLVKILLVVGLITGIVTMGLASNLRPLEAEGKSVPIREKRLILIFLVATIISCGIAVFIKQLNSLPALF